VQPNLLQLSQIDALWVLIAACFVFLMQAGFLCLEAGLARSKHSINVATKNMADYAIASLMFFVIGYGFMFGKSWHGLIGTSDFFLDSHDFTKLIFFFFQLVFCATAATIVSGAVAERMKFKAYFFYSFAISMVIYPIFGHWVWGGSFYTDQAGWLEKLGYLDFAGASVVHQVGAWVALAGIVVLGPRLGKFDAKGVPRQLIGHSVPLALLGIFLLWLGWFGFNGGSTLAFNEDVGVIILNTNLAAAAGALSCLTIGWMKKGRPGVLDLGSGALGGLVAITAGAAFVAPIAAIAIGFIAGLVVFFAGQWLENGLKLDDVVGAVPVHGFCGVWGVLAVAIFAAPDALLHPENRLYHLGIQALGCGACFVLCFGGGLIFFKTLDRLIGIRVESESEIKGLNVMEHGVKSPIQELGDFMRGVSQSKDWTRRPKIDPFDDVGELGTHFKTLLQTIQHTVDELRQKEKLLARKQKDLADLNADLAHAKEGLEKEVEVRTHELQVSKKHLEKAKEGLEEEVSHQTTDLMKSKKDLESKVRQLESFHNITLGREKRIIDLKNEVKRLTAELAKTSGGKAA
jgi:ammonium transporter, Amt family